MEQEPGYPMEPKYGGPIPERSSASMIERVAQARESAFQALKVLEDTLTTVLCPESEEPSEVSMVVPHRSELEREITILEGIGPAIRRLQARVIL